MQRYFSENAILQMRDEIKGAGGNEVFFVGRVDAARIVTDVEAVARGNRNAVAAIVIAASFGDVVIHNHPSGNLTPSQADLEIASLLGNQGIGFYLIDNEASRCYQAVAPFVRQDLERLSFPEMEGFFSEGGILAKNLEGYEYRAEQVRMAFTVAESFNDDKIAVIEAGTGTGKSLAYLYPAALWAVRNKERVIVSTNTINLQEQLTKKDIPFLQKYSGLGFRAILVKGRGNYLCLRKLDAVKQEPGLFNEDAKQELEAIIAWSQKSNEGCRSDLSFIPRDETWEELNCEADQCSRVKCVFYGKCFFYRARREAAGADILVVNHALLMSDVALRQQTGYGSTAVLPPFTRLIFDEGHHLEDVATNYFSSQTSRHGLLHVLGRLQNPRKQQAGILPRISSQLAREIPEELDSLYMEIAAILEVELLPGKNRLSESITKTMDFLGLALKEYLKERRSSDQKLRLTDAVYSSAFWGDVEARVRMLKEEIVAYTNSLSLFAKRCGKMPDEILDKLAGNLIDLKGIRVRLEGTVAQLDLFISRDKEVCRWFELASGKKGISVRLCSAPLEVADSIKSGILDKFKTVVLTSATLAVGDKFDYLEERTGIDLVDRARVVNLLVASPFDYPAQALVAVPSDLPEPTSSGFENQLAQFLLSALTVSQGRAFVLFTSFDLLTRVYGRLRDPLVQRSMTPLRQGQMNRHLLLSTFRKERNPVLFGTDSFWEGVDVQGKALELVVLSRLPFRVPTEPIIEARAEYLAQKGGEPFLHYTVPQAIIKFKQGFGRLIRSREDRGAVLICDTRVLTKNYGKRFLDSLPPVHLVSNDSSSVLAEMEEFFSLPEPSSSSGVQ